MHATEGTTVTTLKTRVGGLAAAAVVGCLALAPAASAATAAPGDCVPSTSPMVSCAPVISAPPGVVTLPPVVTPPVVTPPAKKPAPGATVKAPAKVLSVGSKIVISLSNLKPGTFITFVVHGNKTSKVKVSRGGTVSFSYLVTKAGSYDVSVSGKMLSGKGFGKTYTTLVKAGSGGQATTGTVLTGASASRLSTAAHTATTAHAATHTSKAKTSTPGASAAPVVIAGVSLSAKETGAVSLGTVGLLGAFAAVGLTGRKQARRRKRHATARAWR